MEAIWLVERDGRFRVSREGVQTGSYVSDGTPVVLAPSLTFRKHFQVPGDLDRDPDTVFRELFANFLPGSLDEYRCQFVVESGQGENLDVLGLGVEVEVIEALSLDPETGPGLFCLERLLATRTYDRTTLLEIPFPTGRYLGVYDTSPRWSRFLRQPREQDVAAARDQIEETFGTVRRHDVRAWAQGAQGRDWAREVLELLPDSPGSSLEMLSSGSPSVWARFRYQTWGLLGLLLLALSVWMGVHWRTQSMLRARMDRQFQQAVGRPSRYPLDELQSQVARLREGTERSRVPRQYPRIVRIDRALARTDVTLLRLSLTEGAGRLIFRVPSLEAAEEVRSALIRRETVAGASITSTNSDVPAGFEVNLNLQWKTPS